MAKTVRNMTKQERIEKEIIKVIQEHPKIKRIAHIFRYYSSISYTTFFAYNLNESDGIKKALEQNRLDKCADMIEEMCDSDNPTLKLAGYKLICSDEDREKLATTAKIDAKVAEEVVGQMLIHHRHDNAEAE